MINKQRLIKLTQKVISCNSENPPGHELALAKFIEKDMRSLGLAVKMYTYAKNRPNVVATLKGAWARKKAAREAILITPHFDTVPIGQGWKYNPLGGQVIAGKMYGRGASDDKGNLAAAMEAMRSLAEDKVRLKKDVVMAATVDEETGSQYGIIPLLEKRVLKPRLAMVLDSDGFDTIIAQKGLFHSCIQIFGKKAHGAYNWRGESAIEAAARIITKLKKLKWRFKKHPLLHPPTMNIGVIHGGDKVNIVADFCEFHLDMRFAIGMNPNVIRHRIERVIQSEARRYKFIIMDLQMPYEINPNHPFVQIWIKTAQKLKCGAALKGSNGATVITFFQKYNIPAFATGFGARGTAHTNDEFIFVNALYKGTRALEQYIKEYDAL